MFFKELVFSFACLNTRNTLTDWVYKAHPQQLLFTITATATETSATSATVMLKIIGSYKLLYGDDLQCIPSSSNVKI